MTGRYGPGTAPPSWMPELHRLVGTVAFGASLPVVFHCLWVVGYQSASTRVLLHSTLGCVTYGLYVAKVVVVRSDKERPEILAVTGLLLGVAILGVWWTTALFHYSGFHYSGA